MRPVLAALDVGASSLANLTVSAVAMSVLTLAEFGAFSTTFLVTLVMVGYVKAMTSEPLTLRYAAAASQVRDTAVAAGLGASIKLGTGGMPVVFLLTWGVLLLARVDTQEAAVLAVLTAAGLPGTAAQEYLRGAAYCTGEIQAAAYNSVSRLVLLPLLVLIGWGMDLLSVEFFVLAWWVAALGAAVVGWLSMGRPGLSLRAPWLRDHIALGSRLMADFTLTLTSGQGALLLISSVGGAETIGLIRKAQVVMAPLTLMTTGSISLLQPSLVRRVKAGVQADELRRYAYLASAVIVGLGALWAGAVYLVPHRSAEIVLGDGWARARDILPLVLLYTSLGVLTGMLGIALRALGVVRAQVKARSVLAIPTLLMIGILASQGPGKATIGLCIGVGVVVVVWDILLRRASGMESDAD